MNTPKLDYKTLIVTALLSGGMIGGSSYMGDGVGRNEFEKHSTQLGTDFDKMQIEFRRELNVQELRSNNRYSRGMELAKEMNKKIIDLDKDLTKIKVKNARLEERIKFLQE